MYEELMIEEIKRLYAENPRWEILKKHLSPLFQQVGFKLSQKEVYDIIFPNEKMAPCGKEKQFSRWDRGYVFCGNHCSCANTERNNNTKQTNIERYGVPYALQNSEIKRKLIQTNIERYGVEFSTQNADVKNRIQNTNLQRYGTASPLGSSEIRKKTRMTCLERYGVENPSQSDEVKNKIQQTNIERYGVEHVFQNVDVKDKIKKTNMERYGVENPSQSDQVQDRIKTTNMERYGVENPMQNDAIKQRSKKTNMERYGVEYPTQNNQVVERIWLTNMEKYGTKHATQNTEVKKRTRETNLEKCKHEHHTQEHISSESLRILTNRDLLLAEKNSGLSIKEISTRLGIDQTTFANYWNKQDLPSLARSRSSYELAISHLLSSLGVSFVENDRTILRPKELDFFIPDHNIAIEFNGLFQHSTAKITDTLYHRKKYEGTRDQGIRLLMINQDEWDERSHVIKSRIRNILGLSERGVGARKLHIEEIQTKLAQDFFDKHHVQGSSGSISYSVGAYDGDHLVGSMAFNYQRNTKAIELIRYATDGKTYAGLFTRLLKHAVKSRQYSEIISFADLRYSQGKIYANNGFLLVDEIPPDYRYVYQGKTWHKSSFTKSKIAGRFGIDMSDLTERQAMEELGIPRIYDCGKLKYIIKL